MSCSSSANVNVLFLQKGHFSFSIFSILYFLYSILCSCHKPYAESKLEQCCYHSHVLLSLSRYNVQGNITKVIYLLFQLIINPVPYVLYSRHLVNYNIFNSLLWLVVLVDQMSG